MKVPNVFGLGKTPTMKTIHLEASSWRTGDDFYDAFFKAVGSPSWHGRNFNALRDSIAGGQINNVELPYSVHVTGLSKAAPQAEDIVRDFRDLIRELRAEGHNVEITVEGL